MDEKKIKILTEKYVRSLKRWVDITLNSDMSIDKYDIDYLNDIVKKLDQLRTQKPI